MILSDLLGREVRSASGERLGVVIDARFAVDGPPQQLLAVARLHGLIVSPRSHSSFLGYERTDITAPAPIAAFLRWRERGTFPVLWRDLASLADDAVVLREGAVRYSPRLADAQG
jgi:sporulation protein YlmC with PRC-barrel domain